MHKATHSWIFRPLIEILKFLSLFLGVGTLILTLTCIGLELLNILNGKPADLLYMIYSETAEPHEIYTTLIDRFNFIVPFHHFFELIFDDWDDGTTLLTSFFDYLTALRDADFPTAWKEYSPFLFHDILHTTIVGFFIYIFARIKAHFSKFDGFKVALFFLTVWWYIASCCASQLFLKLVEVSTPEDKLKSTYVIIFAGTLLLRSLTLNIPYPRSMNIPRSKTTLLRILTIYTIDTVFSAIYAVIVWSMVVFTRQFVDVLSLNSVNAFLEINPFFILLTLASLYLAVTVKQSALKWITYFLYLIFDKLGLYY